MKAPPKNEAFSDDELRATLARLVEATKEEVASMKRLSVAIRKARKSPTPE